MRAKAAKKGKSSPACLMLTPGDPDGVGPEIVLKALRSSSATYKPLPLVVVGAIDPFKRNLGRFAVISAHDFLPNPGPFLAAASRSKKICFIPAPENMPSAPPFEISPWKLVPAQKSSRAALAGFQSGWSVEFATRALQTSVSGALVTGPIHKERLQAGGYCFSGHTDLLGHLCNVPENTMMLANDQLRVSLVTVHVGLSRVPSLLDPPKIIRAIEQTSTGLRQLFGLKKPRIAVTALNPHAGEGGLFGREEIEIIAPAIAKARALGLAAEIAGPLPADTLFARQKMAKKSERFDAIVAMYHDQGLIPVKLLDFPKTVNVTLGIPITRTSVDHGTAFDIAGKNLADPSSMISALNLAARFIRAGRN